ncbi:MAG TPA: nuclear transport factor 2 family protein [Candidatus Binatia bacterium]|nr:nuclear transport factor 2 family protein [Candidatus Binatia bacterium]
MMKQGLIWLAMVIVTVVATRAQQGRWLPADDATAKFILDAEEQWDEAACTHNKSPETVLAEDFLGTAPDGTTYTKAQEVKDTQDKSASAHQCHQINPRVRLFGENVAMVYGRAFSVRKGKDGPEAPRCIVFTDTWLKRDSRWQVIAAQDARIPCAE